MGFSISWVGFKGLRKADVLSELKFSDSGETDECNEAPYSLAEIPTGWTILFSNDFDFGSVKRIKILSRNCTVISCQVHEGIMFSAAHESLSGRRVWNVWHNGQSEIYNVGVYGRVPIFFHSTKQSLFEKQNAHGGRNAGVDYIFDLPVELAFRMTGYRHDRLRFDWGSPAFTVVAPMG